MRFYTDDPLRDYDRYCMEQEKLRMLLPECVDCGEKIEDDTCYLINDDPICVKCMEHYQVSTSSLVR